jgi:AMP-binding enzyme
MGLVQLRPDIRHLRWRNSGQDPEPLVAELRKKLSEAHEGLRFGVRVAEPQSLPRFELKAQRVKDEREIWGAEEERTK